MESINGLNELRVTGRMRWIHAGNGVWQGLSRSTGCVASAVWVASDHRQQLVFIDIDGEPLRCQGSARCITP